MNLSTVITILIFLYIVLIWKSGKTYPLLYLFLFTFFLQYIFSTYLIYNQYNELKRQMPIRQEELFDYAVPALSFLFLGVFVFNRDFDVQGAVKRIDPAKATRLGYFLLFISYAFDILGFAGILTVNSIVSFTFYLKYVAVFCFLFSNSRLLYGLSFLVFLHLITAVLRTGVFIDLITWGLFLFFFISMKFKLPFFLRGALFLTAIPVLILIQSVKDEYRKATWSGNEEAGISLFTELARKKNAEGSGEPFEESEGVVRTVARLSQGWHLGLTLRRVPRQEPFADGSEMISDVVSSVIPRFFFPDKKVVHTKEKFYKYTGHKLGPNTSMTIGILGDFYINFGRNGSFVMLFLFGGLISRLVLAFQNRFVTKDPINIVWLPYLFSYLIRADTDFYIFFNCAVKGFVIFLAVNYVRYHYLEPNQIIKPRPISEANAI
jgi:hypothetical protein